MIWNNTATALSPRLSMNSMLMNPIVNSWSSDYLVISNFCPFEPTSFMIFNFQFIYIHYAFLMLLQPLRPSFSESFTFNCQSLWSVNIEFFQDSGLRSLFNPFMALYCINGLMASKFVSLILFICSQISYLLSKCVSEHLALIKKIKYLHFFYLSMTLPNIFHTRVFTKLIEIFTSLTKPKSLERLLFCTLYQIYSSSIIKICPELMK